MPDTETRTGSARRVGSIAAVLLAAVCSLSLVLGISAPPASALTVPNPLVIGTGIRAAPLAGPATVTCAASVVCGGLVLAGGLGYALYSTRDTWLPVVSGWFNDDSDSMRANGSEAYGCPINVTNISATADGVLTVTAAYGVTCTAQSGAALAPQFNMSIGSLQCISTGTDASKGVVGTKYSATGMTSAKFRGNGSGNSPGSVTLQIPTTFCRTGNAGFPYSATLYVTNTDRSGGSAVHEIIWALPDALMSYKTDTTCKRFDGSTFTLSNKEVGQPDRISTDSCYEEDPASIPSGTTVSGPGGTPIITWSPPDWGLDYPNCFGPSGLLCEIYVALDGVKCLVGQALCSDWYNRKEDPRLSCRFGEYVVPFDRCEALKRSYRPGATPDTISDPVTWPPVDPEPDPPTDPETPSPTPTASPSAPPTSGPNPDPPVIGNPEDVDPDSQGCLGENWSWNPVSWVYAPVKCAFIWAFIPKTSISVRIDRIKDALAIKAPFSWFGGFGSISAAIPSGNCPNWVVKVDGRNENVVCGKPYTDAIRGMRPVFLVFMGSLALWPLIRSTAYAAFPIIKPQPGMLR